MADPPFRRPTGLLALRPGLCSVTLRELSPSEVIEVAHRAGVAGIEWGADIHVPLGALDVATAVAEECAEAGLVCPSYGTYLRAGELDRAELDDAVRTTSALGASNLRVWCRWLSAADATDDDRRAMADDLGRMAARALREGMTVSVEYHPFTLTEEPASAVALLDAVGAPNLFTYWQPAEGGVAAELLAEMVRVRHHLSHLHVFRWDTDGVRLPLGEGADLWEPALAAARRSGRWVGDRWAFLEFVRHDDPAQVVADAATLRSWLGGTTTTPPEAAPS
ncbi:MAG: sugar phosphate isomerase/epimerase [Acidimicrobiia bacterium]|nr:sugar phosphate isomerase/epimerase [Acidimicrobiia bacterium]